MRNKNNISWVHFKKELIAGAYYEFKFRNVFINFGLEIRGFIHKKKEWIFIMHKHDNNGPLIYSKYKSPELLIENVRIFENKLFDIWNELELV